MTDFLDTQGAAASSFGSSFYSGNFFSYPIDGTYSAYYVTRYASAVNQSIAGLSGNSISLFGSADGDQVFINAQASASDGSVVFSNSNNWFVDLGDGDDSSVIHSLVFGIGAGTSVNLTQDSSTLYGGNGADTLQTTQYLGGLDLASTSIGITSRYISGGAGYDLINAEVTIESGRSGSGGGYATYWFNSTNVDAGGDGGQILAVTFINSYGDGIANHYANSSSYLNGSVVNANVSIIAGSAELSGGLVSYASNSLTVSTDFAGGNAFAQNTLSASNGASIFFEDNTAALYGNYGSDLLSAGIGFNGGSVDLAVGGGTASVLGNAFFAYGDGGSDVVNFYLNGWAENGGSASFSGNSFHGDGGEGDDTLTLNWWTLTNGGSVEFSGNSAELSGGSGADTLNAYLGEGIDSSLITLSGGDGDDLIQSIDLGQDNVRLISGGAGNDTVVDDAGFSTVLFDGAFSDYTLTALNGGWIAIADNRGGSPDGTDQLYQVDQLRFADGDVLVSDLYLPIQGTEGADTLFGGNEGSIIFGYGGSDQIIGGDGNDRLDGGAGNDVLTALGGNDILLGGSGNDQLIGNRGVDQLTGGTGADRFIFGALFQSTTDAPDLITDFSGQSVFSTNGQGHAIRTPGDGDKIDLSLIDANTGLAGDQAFTLVQHGFSGHAAEAYGSFDIGTGITSLYMDVNGDGVADMTIQLLGKVSFTGADFIL
ncbi:MAG TPA: calcium-binding protein [Sphingomicrobium sp.]|nr:calcium-binding protein [Sphingomicrobium sp.]